MKTDRKTTMAVKRSTKDLLDGLGMKSDTYDDIIRRLIFEIIDEFFVQCVDAEYHVWEDDGVYYESHRGYEKDAEWSEKSEIHGESLEEIYSFLSEEYNTL